MCGGVVLVLVFFVNGCNSNLGTGNSKDTMREIFACPGYVANGSFLLAGPNPGNTPAIWLQ